MKRRQNRLETRRCAVMQRCLGQRSGDHVTVMVARASGGQCARAWSVCVQTRLLQGRAGPAGTDSLRKLWCEEMSDHLSELQCAKLVRALLPYICQTPGVFMMAATCAVSERRRKDADGCMHLGGVCIWVSAGFHTVFRRASGGLQPQW